MKSKKEFSTAKRFGTRYGSTVKHRFAAIERQHRTLQICPYCKKEKVKRQAVGIWECKKCNAKFTGKAYTLAETEK